MSTKVLPPGTPIPDDMLYEVVDGQILYDDGEIPDNSLEDVLYEVIDGSIVEKSVGAFEIDVASILFGHMVVFTHATKIGRVESEMLFHLDATKPKRRRPDLAFVSYGRWPRKKRIPRGDAWEVVPELPIEVVSPKNTAEEVLKKIRDYFDAGCLRVWVIYPTEQQVYVYQSPTQNRILTAKDELDGEDILPGFRLPVASLFEADED